MRTDVLPSDEDVEVYDIASGLGGTYTVSVIEDKGEGLVLVRIWFGRLHCGRWQSFGLFDGRLLTVRRNDLGNRRFLNNR